MSYNLRRPTQASPFQHIYDSAYKSLYERDFHQCRHYAAQLPPNFSCADRILAVADILIASESTIPYTLVPNHYSVLNLPNFCHNPLLISQQFNTLFRLVNYPLPFAIEALQHLLLAHSVLTDPVSKLFFDCLLQDSELTRNCLPFRATCDVCSLKFVFDSSAYSNGLLICTHCRRLSVGDYLQPDELNELVFDVAQPDGRVFDVAQHDDQVFDVAQHDEQVFDVVCRHEKDGVDCMEWDEACRQADGYLVDDPPNEMVDDGVGVVEEGGVEEKNDGEMVLVKCSNCLVEFNVPKAMVMEGGCLARCGKCGGGFNVNVGDGVVLNDQKQGGGKRQKT